MEFASSSGARGQDRTTTSGDPRPTDEQRVGWALLWLGKSGKGALRKEMEKGGSSGEKMLRKWALVVGAGD